MALYTEEKPFFCEICKSSFMGSRTLELHMKTHYEDSQYNCEICHTNHPIQQLKTQTGEKLHVVQMCPKVISWRGNLEEKEDHYMLTDTKDKLYACEICKKSFSQNVNLADHMRIHTEEKSYTCEICQKTISTNQSLKIHTRTHSVEKRYSCETCPKTYTTKQNLKKHMRTHTKEKPYSFYYEGEQETHRYTGHIIATQGIDTQEHRITHIKGKLYSCDTCPKTYTSNQNLKKHMRTHIKEKPYSFYYEGEQETHRYTGHIIGTQGIDTQEHRRTHIKGKLYSCETCPKTYTSNQNLKKHMRTHTKDHILFTMRSLD